MPTAVPYLKEHETIARQLVAETRRHDGLAPLDLEQFWADQEIAIQDPFGTNIPQPPFGAILTWETVFDELGIEENVWRYQHDETWQLELNRAFNNKAERIVGRRPLPETLPPKEHLWPQTKGLADVFEARTVWHDQSWWIQQSAHTEDELNALLDRVETRNIRDCILPPNWDKEKNRLTALGIAPPSTAANEDPSPSPHPYTAWKTSSCSSSQIPTSPNDSATPSCAPSSKSPAFSTKKQATIPKPPHTAGAGPTTTAACCAPKCTNSSDAQSSKPFSNATPPTPTTAASNTPTPTWPTCSQSWRN